jgi:predicted phage terminase large subunit-like protein
MTVLEASAVEGFVTRYLLPRYDRATPIKGFHRDWWQMSCLPDSFVAIAAPRGHSKSASINIGFSMAAALIRSDPFQLKISRTRPVAVEFLRTVKNELQGNDELIDDFGILPVKEWPRDTEDDFICACEDGYQFRMIALGCEQPMRGLTWGTKRPSLVICDDMEDSEQVLSMDRREKVQKWLMGTLLPIGTVDTKFRVIGTILHAESVLKNLCESEGWVSRVYEACDENVAEDSLLWPELFPKKRLENIKKHYIEIGNLIEFNMEYRNIAVDTSSGYFQSQDFVRMEDSDHYKPFTFYVGVDFAISAAERRDYTAIVIGGVDSEGFLHILEIRRGRWDAKQLIDEMLSVQETYKPELWFVESGAIQKALWGGLEVEQRSRGVYLNLRPMVPTKDKQSRARSIQARMRSRAVRFNHDSDWYAEFEQELLQFPRGRHDDQVDAFAWLGIGLASMVLPETAEDAEEREWKQARQEAIRFVGVSSVTGY